MLGSLPYPARDENLGARNPLPLPVAVSSARLEQLIARAASTAHHAADPAAVRDALLDAAGTSRQRLVRASSALGLRVTVITLSVAEAVASASTDAPLFALVGEDAFLTFEGVEGKRARVVGMEGEASLLEVDLAAKRLGLSHASDEATFFSFEPSEPGAVSDDGHGHGHAHATPWQRLRALVSVERAEIGTIVIYGVLVGLSALAVPVTAQALVGSIAMGTLLQPVVVMTVVLLAALSFSSAMRIVQVRLVEALQERLFVHAALRIGRRTARARADAFGGEHPPEQLNRFFDILTVQKAAAALLLDGLAITLQLVVGLALLAFYHPLLLAFDALLIVGLLVVIFGLGSGGVATSIKESKAKYAVVAWIQELGRHDTTFRARSAEGFALDTLDERLRTYVGARRKHFRVVLRQTIGVLSLHTLASAAVLGLGAFLVIQQKLTLGQLVAAEIVVNTVVAGISKLGKYLETAYDLAAALDKLGHIEEIETHEERGPGPSGESAFDLSCTMNGRSCCAAPGERVAVIRSLRGDAEVLDRAFGLGDDPSIRIDGVPLTDLSLGAYRDEAKLVRGAEIFAGSILDNVRAGRDMSVAEARRALRAVLLDDALERLPAGLHTHVTTHGAPLSADEAQRLTLARALAARPRLLLLDGTLDALSPRVRNAVIEELDGRRSRTTVVIATHQPSVAALCDRALHVPSQPPQEAP